MREPLINEVNYGFLHTNLNVQWRKEGTTMRERINTGGEAASIFSISWKAMGQYFYTMKTKVKDMTSSGELEGLIIREVVE